MKRYVALVIAARDDGTGPTSLEVTFRVEDAPRDLTRRELNKAAIKAAKQFGWIMADVLTVTEQP